MTIALFVLGIQVVAGLVHQWAGTVSPAFEIVHVLLVIILFGLFAVAADTAQRATPGSEPRHRVLR